MPDVLLTTHGSLQANGRFYRFGSRQPQRHTVTADNVRDDEVTLTGGVPGPTVLVWTALLDRPASFKFLVIEVDLEVVVEFVTDEDASVGEEVYTVTVKPGVPLMLASDASYANYAVNFGGGTLDKIETIRARREAAGNAVLKYLIAD